MRVLLRRVVLRTVVLPLTESVRHLAYRNVYIARLFHILTVCSNICFLHVQVKKLIAVPRTKKAQACYHLAAAIVANKPIQM